MIRYEANLNGDVIPGEPFTKFNELDELEKIFDSLGWKHENLYSGRGGYYLFLLTLNDRREIHAHIYLKRITFGGRENLPYEKRAQFSAAIDRKGFIKSEEETTEEYSLILGIYKNENFEDAIICAWDIHDWGHNIGRAFNCFVDVKAIAFAYKNGFSQHKSSKGQIVCCFKASQLLYYFENRHKLHKELKNEFINKKYHFKPLNDEIFENNYTDEIPKYPDLFQLVINVLKKHNGIANTNNIEFDTAEELKLTETARLKIHNENEGFRSELGYQLAWSRYYLKRAGLIESPKRLIWSLTELGWNTSQIDKSEIVKLATQKEVQTEIDNDTLFTVISENDIENENDSDNVLIDNPFDPNQVDIRTRTMSLDLILKRLKSDAIDMNTSFQRKPDLWNSTKQSRLIESILVKFPLPAFYFDGSNDNNWLVVDGLQRLSSLDNYVNKESFPLQNLEFLNQFNGYKFSELPSYLQRRIEEFEITAYVIAAGTPTVLKFNVFKRINTGGLILTTQEIRNALYQGRATEFVKKLSELRSFKMATTFTIPEDRLLDQEFVNRFLAFYLFDLTEYNSDLDGFLNNALDLINKDLSIDIHFIETVFDEAMKTSIKIFSNDAFRKRFNKKDKRKPINKALFEVWSVLLSKLNVIEISLLTNRNQSLQEKFILLLNSDEDFNKAITSGTGDKSRVRKRFIEIKKIIQSTILE
ncbi:GmrSD restriction endonuclease domain-containing protein [Flavobacterium bizetiae]|uniref:GmrSD restriction endonuclease domain-containing protein n=1 Tax=Flavobacterium bizetiae TaxID=2704140 RepID=UPI0037576209